jgi:hypothetical protein
MPTPLVFVLHEDRINEVGSDIGVEAGGGGAH